MGIFYRRKLGYKCTRGVERCRSPTGGLGRLGPRRVESAGNQNLGHANSVPGVDPGGLRRTVDPTTCSEHWHQKIRRMMQPSTIGRGPAAPDGSPHCNASNAAGRTGAQGGNPNGSKSFLGSWADAFHMIDGRLLCRELWFVSCKKLILLDASALVKTCWTEAVSSHDQHGKSCARARDLLSCQAR